MYTSTIFNAMDNLFEFANHSSKAYSNTDIKQTEEGYLLEVLLPGFIKSEVTIRTEGTDLILEASTKRELPHFLNNKVSKRYQVEFLDSSTIEAKLEFGVLSIRFSTEKRKNSRNVTVQ